MVVRTTSHQEQPSSCPERGGSCPAHAHATPSSRTGRSTGRDRVVVRAERYMLAARARERGGCGVSHFIEGIKLLKQCKVHAAHGLHEGSTNRVFRCTVSLYKDTRVLVASFQRWLAVHETVATVSRSHR